MTFENKKEELKVTKASSYDIKFPDNKYLEDADIKKFKMLLKREVFPLARKLTFLQIN